MSDRNVDNASTRGRLHRFVRKSPLDQCVAVIATLRSALQACLGITSRSRLIFEIGEIRKLLERSAILEKEQFLANALANERYADPKRLERHGYKVYSQFDEDGILDEIFDRIGTTDRRFVEFGVEGGLENNTLKRLLEGWHGLWIEGSDAYVAAIEKRFEDVIAEGRLTVKQGFITAENVNSLIGSWVTGEVDLLSIDIDGNDYHVWQAITVISPRVIVIEYNAKFPPPISIVQRYASNNVWRGTDYMGASISALVILGDTLGYSLVGTNFAGVNAFFIRKDLIGDKFQAPFSAENHYNLPRYFLAPLYVAGHSPDWGPYTQVARGD